MAGTANKNRTEKYPSRIIFTVPRNAEYCFGDDDLNIFTDLVTGENETTDIHQF
jgi:hypothetical protein